MDQLTYKQLQKLAKEYGIPANLKKDNMLLLIKKAKEEQEAHTSTESTEDEEENTTKVEMEQEEVQEVEIVASAQEKEEVVVQQEVVVEVEQGVFQEETPIEIEQEVELQMEKEEEVEVVVEEEEIVEAVVEVVKEEGTTEVVTEQEDVQEVEVMALAQEDEVRVHEEVVQEEVVEVEVKGNVEDVMEVVIEKEEEEETKTDTLDNAYTSFANVIHELASEQQTPTPEEEENIDNKPEEEQEEEQEQEEDSVGQQVVEEDEVVVKQPVLSVKETMIQNFSQLDFKDLQKVAKSLGITANVKRATMTALIVEEQLAHQANVVVEMTCDSDSVENTPVKDVTMAMDEEKEVIIEKIEEVSSKEIDLIFDAAEDDQNIYEGEYEDYDHEYEYEQEQQQEEEENFSHQKKLFTTPAKNTKTIFTSPSPSKSGTKPYEKFNVTWTYDDFENKDPQKTPIGAWMNTDGESASEDPSSRVGGKMKGMATPKGSKIAFTSPLKSTEKQYYQYNVHWSYDQYLAADEKY